MRQRRVAAGSSMGTGLSTTAKYVRRTASGAAGNGRGTTVQYLRRTRNGTAGNDLGTTIKYLQRTTSGAAGYRLLPRPSRCVAPRALAWTPRLSTVPSIFAWSPRFLLVFINKVHTSLLSLSFQRLKILFLYEKNIYHVSLTLPPRRACV
jgi:hypothetical protein